MAFRAAYANTYIYLLTTKSQYAQYEFLSLLSTLLSALPGTYGRTEI